MSDASVNNAVSDTSTNEVGDVSFNGTIFVNDVSINGGLIVGGDVSFNQDLNVLGNTNISGKSNFESRSTFENTTKFSKTANFVGGAQFSGPTTTYSSNVVYQADMVANNMTIEGSAIFSGQAIYNNAVLIGSDTTIEGRLFANYADGSIPSSAISGQSEGGLSVTGTLDVTDKIGIKNAEPVVSLDLSGCTDAIRLPVGSTEERPESTDETHQGYIR